MDISTSSTSLRISSKWKNSHQGGAKASTDWRLSCRSLSNTYTAWTKLAATDLRLCSQFLLSFNNERKSIS
jgi:hypothetical protein